MTFDRKAPMRVRSHCASTLQPEGHRSVVDERHLHVGTEYPARHARVLLGRGSDQGMEQARALLGRRGRGEARTQALAGLCGQCELRYQQEISVDLLQT